MSPHRLFPDVYDRYFARPVRSGHLRVLLMLCLFFALSVLPAYAAASLEFATAVDYSVGNRVFAVAAGDFNLDGKLDLAASNYMSSTVSVLLGNGDGTYAAKVDYSTGTSTLPAGMAVGDFNRDGKPDLATANYGTDNVSVLDGNGAGSFAAARTYATGTSPYHVTISDFNLDGKLDLAVTNYASNSLSVLLGNGDGTFAVQVNFSTGASSLPYALVTPDINLDGKPDLVSVNYSADNMSVFLNSTTAGAATPTFGTRADFATGDGPYGVAVGDFNRDGRPDLVTANVNSDNASVILNTTAAGAATPTFATKVDYSTGDMAHAAAVGDFNGDGKADVAVTNRGHNSVSVLVGDGGGSFAAAVSYGTGTEPRSVATGDYNRDGLADLATANYNNGAAGTVSVILNASLIDRAGTFATNVDYGQGNRVFVVAAGDFNLDGKLDLAATNYLSNTVSVRLGNGDGTYAAKLDYSTGASTLPAGVTVGDFNRDGKPDLATANYSGNNVSVLDGNGDGTFAAARTYATESSPYRVTISDFNLDGKLDLAATNYNSNNVSVLLGNGDGTFAARVSFSTGTSSLPYALNAADINLDGKPDLVTANYLADNMSVFLNTTTAGAATPTFGTRVDFATSDGPYSVAVDDFNRDGSPDLVTANLNSDNASVFLNTTTAGAATPTFAAKTDYYTGDAASAADVGDFNGDGKADVAITNQSSSSVTVLVGDGAGSFVAAASRSTGTHPRSVTTGDFNRDGLADLATANHHSGAAGSVSVLLGAYLAPGVTTDAATSVTSGSATLTGTANANAATATVTFEYGMTTGYGTSVAAIPGTVTGSSTTAVSTTIAALSPNTLYHYRVVGVNAGGTSHGSDSTFTTAAALAATGIVKTALPTSEVTYRSLVTYTLVLRNTGTADDPGVFVTDTLPVGTAFAGWVTQAGAAIDGRVVTWNGAVNAGTAITVAFAVTNTASGGATITNTAIFSGSRQAGNASAVYTATSDLYPSGSGNWHEVYPPCSSICKYVAPAGVTITLGLDLELAGDFEIEPGGTFVPDGKTVTLTGDQAQTLTGDPLTFYNLVLDKTVSDPKIPVTIVGKLKVTKKVTVRSGKLVSASDYGDIEIDDGGELELTKSITISGNLIVSGTLTTNDKAITFDGGIDQGATVTQTLFLSDTTWFGDINVYTDTLLIEVNPNDTVLLTGGALTNYGTIRKTQPISGLEPYYFGLAGMYPGSGGMQIDVANRTGGDPLTAIQVERIDADHPNAPIGAATGIYWRITPSGTKYVATVVLPQNALTNPGACRYDGSAWQCGRTSFDSVTDLTVTREGVTAFSDWAVFETQATTTTLATSGSPVAAGTLVTFTATVAPSGVPGSVAFFADGVSLGSAAVNASSAQTATAGLTLGTHVITATFTPTGAYLPSSGSLTPAQEVICINAAIVANTADGGAGSLRWAIANACAGGMIGFDPTLTAGGAATITLSSGQPLTLTKDVTIAGPGAGLLDVNGNASTRVFVVNSGVSATLDGLTIRDGKVTGPTNGAGILNSGVLTLSNSTLTANSAQNNGAGIYSSGTLAVISCTVADNSGFMGTGIYNTGTLALTGATIAENTSLSSGGGIYNSGTLTAVGSTFSVNRGSMGGGIYNSGALTLSLSVINANASTIDGAGVYNTGWLRVEESRFSTNTGGWGAGIYNAGISAVTGSSFVNNVTGGNGGGIAHFNGALTLHNSTLFSNTAAYGGGILSTAALTITNSTLSGNSSTPGNGGAGLLNYAALVLRNTLIANSTGDADCTNNGTIAENTNSLVEDGTCSAALSGDPLLGAFGDYGGATQTLPLLPGSLAIDAGDAGTCLVTDQRGIGRVGACDIGAFESRGFSLSKGTGDGQSAPWGTAFGAPITVAVSSAYTEPVEGGGVTYGGPLSGAGTAPITNTVTIVGNAGIFTPTANSTVGGYNVTASTAGASPAITFGLTNTVRTSATTLDAAPNSSVLGDSVTFTAIVTDNAGSVMPTGAVTFTVNSAKVPATLVDGVATYVTDTLVVGSHVITATYGGNDSFNGSVDDMTQVVNRAATSAALASTPNPSVYGQSVIFTATVTAAPPDVGLPTGVVTFTDGTTPLGTGTLDASGVATYMTSSLDAYDGGQYPPSPATHAITAEYGGDGSFAGSTSAAVIQIVGKASTTTTLASGLNPSVYGDSATFTATVTVQAPGAGSMVSEEVTFKDGATTLGMGTLDAGGVATYTTSLLSGGMHTITAAYGGRTNLTGSVSSGVVQIVSPANQTISFDPLSDQQYGADPFVVTATASSGLTVVFTSTTPSICTVSGSTISLADNGGCTIRASQPGDGNYTAASDVDRSFNLTCADSVVVNNAADSGYRTLRGAVANLCDGGTITFDAALDNQTIALTTGQIEITKTLTIDGPGADKLAVSGNNASRIFAIGAGNAVAINGLTLRNGRANDTIGGGGAIYNAGTLTITNSSVVSNSTTLFGGGVLSQDGNLSVTSSTFTSNNAMMGAGIMSGGAGVLNLTDSLFAGNRASFSGGGISNGATMTVTGSTFSDNRAASFGGGGIHNGGSLSVSGCTFDSNQSDAGGGVYNGFALTIADSTLTGNTATNSGGGIYNGGRLTVAGSLLVSDTAKIGGGIYSAGPLTITGSSLVLNTAGSSGAGQGGAVSFDGDSQYALVVSATSFLSNTAYGLGGALHVISGTLDLDNSTLAGNLASGDQEQGGALYCGDCVFTIDGASFTGNEARYGGAFYITESSYAGQSAITDSDFQDNRAAPAGDGLGGALFVEDYLRIVISDTQVLSNEAAMGGGVYIAATYPEQGVYLYGSRIVSNTAIGSGGGIVNAGALHVAGAIFAANHAEASAGALQNTGWFAVTASEFLSNTAKDGGAIAVEAESTNASVSDSIFAGNSSNCHGGAIYGAGQVSVDTSELYGNQAGLECKSQALGGAIYVANELSLWTSTLHANRSTGGGGAIGIAGSAGFSSTVQIRGSAVYSNSALYAGAVAIGGPSTTHIEQSAIYSNTAMMVGGIGSGYGGATLDIVNSTLAGNAAEYTASALLVADGAVVPGSSDVGYGPDTVTLHNVTIAGNRPTSVQSPGNFFAFVGLDSGYGGPMLTITNTIIAGGSNGEQACFIGAPNTQGGAPAVATNLDNDGTCGSGFRQSDTILLGPLGEYGTPLGAGGIEAVTPLPPSALVFPLLPGSAAIDAGSSGLVATPNPESDCPYNDQRGVSRPQGSACDIGAFESQGFTLAKTGGDGQGTLWGDPFANVLAASISSSHDEPVNGGVVTFAGPLSGAGVVPITQTATVAGGTVSVTVGANHTAGVYSVTVPASGAQPVAFSLTNLPHATQTSVQSSLNPSLYSQAVTLTASVAVSGMTSAGQITGPTGQVRFADETGVLATVALVNGIATFSRDTWAIGTHTVTAEYLGDDLYSGSSSDPLAQVVGQHGTVTKLTSAPNPSKVSDTIVLTATVEKQVAVLLASPPADPSGQVHFYSGAALLDTVNLSDGVAVLERSDLPVGVFTLTAVYGGDSNYSGSTSDAVQQTVQPLPMGINDAAGTLEGGAVRIDPLANDLDPAGGGLTVTAVGQPGHGAAVIDAGARTVTYTPDPAFSGVDSFLYTLQDGNGNRDDALVAVVVTARSETGVAPQIGVIDNETGSNLTFPDAGAQVNVVLPPGSFSGTLGMRDVFYLAYTAVVTPTGDVGQQPGGLHFGNLVFDLGAFLNGGQLAAYVFPQPVTVVITYNPALLFGLNEGTLTLLSWDGGAWSSDGIVFVGHDLNAHTLTVTLAHLSEYALFAAPGTPTALDPEPEPDAYAQRLYLPVITAGDERVQAQGLPEQSTPAAQPVDADTIPGPDAPPTPITPDAIDAADAPAVQYLPSVSR